MRIFYTFLPAFFWLSACYSQKADPANEGVITARIFDHKNLSLKVSLLEQVLTADLQEAKMSNIFFWGSYCIEIVSNTKHTTLISIADSSSKTTISYDTSYWLIDNNKARCFQFRGFSDTSGIISRSLLKDKSSGLGASPSRITDNPKIGELTRTQLSDTIIANKLYRRLLLRAVHKEAQSILLVTYYFDPSLESVPDFYAKQDAEINGEERGFLKLIEMEAYLRNGLADKPVFKSSMLFEINEKPLGDKWENIFKSLIARVENE